MALRRSAVISRSTGVLLALLAALVAPAVAAASLADVFDSPQFAQLGLAPLGPAFANTVASTYPIASASSSVTYAYNPAFDTLERRRGVLGPILGERAETLGRGQVNFWVSYSFVHLDTINAKPLDDLVNAPKVQGRLLFLPVPGGVRLQDGRVTTFLPVRVSVDIDVTAHIATPSLTYGVTPDLDVSATLPVLRTSLHLGARTRVPDPRLPQFTLPPGDPAAGTDDRSASATSAGVGDLLLRTKYVLHRGAPANLAAGLGLSLPSGRRDDFQGTGTTRVQPMLIASRTVRDRVELLANAGVDFDANDVDRSILRWAAGGTAAVAEPLTAAIVFLGRHELAAQSDRIRVPFFTQIERNDLFDFSAGLRWRFTAAGVISLNALIPLNRQGLRADVIPTAELEFTF